jgi:class 3 adenylate cyclase
LLFIIGIVGFIYARNIMLEQWREASRLKLERAAHRIDMKLAAPIELIRMVHRTGGDRSTPAIQQWLLDQLEKLDGVTRVNMTWKDGQMDTMRSMHGSGRGHPQWGRMRFHRARFSKVTPPHFDTLSGQETVSLVSLFLDKDGAETGRLQVEMSFTHLISEVQKFGWWQSDRAFIVDQSGRFLTHGRESSTGRLRLGETKDPLENEILKGLQGKKSGMVSGPGHPPDQIGGFYRMVRAPWTLVIIAPGEKILAPIVTFRNTFFLAGAVGVVVILLLIRVVVGRMTRAIREVSGAADDLAEGRYGEPLPVKSRDEIGRLMESFNTMVHELKEKEYIRNTFGRYVDDEVAHALLSRPEATELGGVSRQVAILMADIRGFTPLAEALSPEKTVSLLNHYFTHMVHIIKTYRGIVVDYFGDGALVFFDPLDETLQTAVRRAVNCALDMQKEMPAFNHEIQREALPELEIGIGVHAGEVVVGNMGSETRKKYGIIGSEVNLTQRIQSLSEPGTIVVSDSVLPHVPEGIQTSESFETRLKVISTKIRLHRIVLQSKPLP